MKIDKQIHCLRCTGFTLIEVLIASAISVLVIAGTLSTYIWMMRTACESRQYAWAQTEAVISANKVVSFIRNATAIAGIATNGNWVQLRMPDGTTGKFSYVNTLETPGEGKLNFQRDISDSLSETTIVAQGVTKVMTIPTRNIFQQTGNNSLRIAYRITEPLKPGHCPAEVDVGVRLRNY